jgi:hypothetical protein
MTATIELDDRKVKQAEKLSGISDIQKLVKMAVDSYIHGEKVFQAMMKFKDADIIDSDYDQFPTSETQPKGGTELTDDEIRAMGMTPDPTLEECLAEAEFKRQRRINDPEHYSLERVCGTNWDGKRTHEQIIADAVAEQREARDEWDD